MSNNQTEQQKKNRKAFSKTLKAQIKRKPHTQPINGIQYTYGILQKKSESSLFNNERFLIIRGHQTFGYASKLPDQTLLPFLEQKNIPKCKTEIDLDKLEINNQKEVLVVEFLEQGKKEKTRWDFTCGSKVKAIEWRQKLQGAKSQKILSTKNNAVKIILQDPNESVEQSQNQTEKRKKKLIIIEQPNSNANSQGKKGQTDYQNKENERSKILVKDEDQNDQNKPQLSLNGKNEELKDTSRKQLFPQVNIFQSLIYSSPNRQTQQKSQNLSLSSRQKSSRQNTGENLTKNIESQNFANDNDISPNNRAKQQFLKRKREQSEIIEQLREQSSGPSFFGSVLLTLTDSKYQIQKLRKEWGYEFAKGVNEYEIVDRFKLYVEIIVSKIVDELALQARKRYYKSVSESSESIKYEIDGVSLEFYYHQLKEVTSFQKKGSIISTHRSKKANQQLKNYDYILQLTNNKGRIRVPLAMTVQYKGFTCLAKAIIPEADNYANLESLQKELDLLQAQSRISNSIFEDGENGRIVPLNAKVYEKLARTQNNSPGNGQASNSKKFDICYVEGLKHYLPQDFYLFTNNSTNPQTPKDNNQSAAINPTHILRKQLIQDEEYDSSVFYGQNMTNIINRLKMPQHLKEAIDTLTEVSRSIPDRVNALVLALENLDEFVTNSKDLSRLMHGYGINMRYLGLLLERSHQIWLKSIIISEISARCAKSFLQFDLQDCITNLNETKIQNIRRYQIKQVIMFLNKLLGQSEQSDQFWNQLSRQSQENFQCYVDRKQLNVGYFLQALQYQCRIQLVNLFEKREELFRVAEPLGVENFCGFAIHSKTYGLQFTELYTTVTQHLKDISQESFQQLSIFLSLQRKASLPDHFRLNNFDEKIILYMINWLSPTEGRQVYYPDEIKLGEVMPSKTLYQVKLTEIKWLLKDKKEREAEQVRDWIIEHVNQWLGEYHPILSQLYDLFSRYYSTSNQQQKKATTYCKSSIKNLQKLLSQSNNIKLADNYYMLGEVYVNYQKRTEALSSLNRAREILEDREAQDTQAYGVIELRIGQLLLATGNVQEALGQAVRAYGRVNESQDLEKLVEVMELIGRCYELMHNWADYTKFSEEIISNTNKLQLLAEDPLLLQRSLKTTILPYLASLTKNTATCKHLLTSLASFSSLSNITTSSQSASFSYLQSLILQQHTFPQEFIAVLESDLQELLQEVESSGIMTRWKGFENLIQNKSLVQKINSISAINGKAYEFLLTLEALAVFLGEGWMEAVLLENY